MSAPLIPSPLDYIGRRSFAFYPAIREAVPNSWMLGSGGWSEVQVINSHTGQELWIPRQYIGSVSEQENSIVVELIHDVECRDGEVVPRSKRRLIEMPLPAKETQCRQSGPASVIGIRLESHSHSVFQKTGFRVGIAILFVVGLLALVASTSHMR